jgi:hypothetical protein
LFKVLERIIKVNQKFYELSHNLDRFQPDGPGEFGDGYLENEFSNWDEMDSAIYKTTKIDLVGEEGVIIREKQSDNLFHIVKAQMPANLIFVGFDDLFSYTDYPYLPKISFWPIMSRKMLNVLLSIRDFHHQAIPIIFKHIENFSLDQEERKRISLIRNNNFVILQLLEYLDAFDKSKSGCHIEYGENLFGEKVESLRITGKIVLKEPANGFPPIFRLKENSIPLYVSAEAKEALEKAGIQGLDFSSYNIESS